MLLTFAAQNLKFGGLYDDNGRPQDRWPLIAERLRSIDPKPDFVLFSEGRDWSRQGHGPLARAAEDLDMDPLPLAPSKSGQPVVLLYRKETVGRWKHWNLGYTEAVTQSFGVAAFDVGLPSQLSVVPVHLDPFSKDKAVQEASLIASRGYRHGPLAVIGGDINYPPAAGPEPVYSNMRPYNVASRTILTDPAEGAKVAPDRRIAWSLQHAGYVDVAYHLYEKTGDKNLLKRTASDDRIDQFWVSQPLADAIVNYWIVDEPREASDHSCIVFQLDTERIAPTEAWTYD